MIGLDTSVLVRYLAQDAPVQSPAADRLIGSLTQENPGFIGIVTLIETLWVLRRTFHLRPGELADTVNMLLTTDVLVVQEADAVARAWALANEGFDLPDALVALLAAAAGCDHTATFDREAASIPGMKAIDY